MFRTQEQAVGIPVVQKIGRGILWLEPLVLALTLLAFWYPPPTRDEWLWLLLLQIPIYMARLVLRQRLFSRTAYDLWFALFLLLGIVNVFVAPYTRGLSLLARPLLGMLVAYALVENARTQGRMRGPLRTRDPALKSRWNRLRVPPP